ncbi:hypothetical protein [Mesorhizobium marinum]|uniref:Uncharacterized protein n=1 Tax=Mesorhizobium marinum TaxID=3228790 RepID=A0ABV3QWN9_9HYPH
MRSTLKMTMVLGLAAAGSGCMSDELRRADGLTDGAGESIAANTVMQMVDPWPNGVQDTRLLVPAARATSSGGGEASTDAKQSQTTTGSN